MANATAIVKKGFRNIVEVFRKRSFSTLASETRFYPNAMLGYASTGYLAKMDDTQSLTLAGIVRNDHGNPLLPSGTAGDEALELDYHCPPAFDLAISGVAIGSIGRMVYALDDQTGTLDPSATTYANVVGVVAGYRASGIGTVTPIYGESRALGSPLQIAANSGAVAIKTCTVLLTKAGVAAMTLADPTSGTHDGVEICFLSTTANAHTVSNAAGSGFFSSGGASKDVATFGGAIGDGFTVIAYAGKWYLKPANTNVTLG